MDTFDIPGAADMSPAELAEAKAVAQSKSHSEAERRRRERINSHLGTLRSLLPSGNKVRTAAGLGVPRQAKGASVAQQSDKASLLGEVIEYVKDLKRQARDANAAASTGGPATVVPGDADELQVELEAVPADGGGGKRLICAAMCCEDRLDLLADLVSLPGPGHPLATISADLRHWLAGIRELTSEFRSLQALKLRTVRAEIVTLGTRVKNVFVMEPEPHGGPAAEQQQLREGEDKLADGGVRVGPPLEAIRGALQVVMQRGAAGANSGGAAADASRRLRAAVADGGEDGYDPSLLSSAKRPKVLAAGVADDDEADDAAVLG
eukprot:SM000322S12506  [mRNA]  locus=s322:45579:46616:- [translate_table: standard]